jgi:hypothetical protein
VPGGQNGNGEVARCTSGEGYRSIISGSWNFKEKKPFHFGRVHFQNEKF